MSIYCSEGYNKTGFNISKKHLQGKLAFGLNGWKISLVRDVLWGNYRVWRSSGGRCPSGRHPVTGRVNRVSQTPPTWVEIHYNDVIMSAMASQISSITIDYWSVHSGADQRKHQSSASLPFVWGEFTGDRGIPVQMTSNAANASIWWLHHDLFTIYR